MFVILPDEVEGLDSVENKIASSNFETIIHEMYNVEVQILLPKFKIEKTIQLNDVLCKVSIVFS